MDIHTAAEIMYGAPAPTDERLPRIVADAFEHGALLGHGYPKTMTLAGKRRYTIRVQSDIFRAVCGGEQADSFYPDLWPAIHSEVRAAQLRRKTL